MSQVGDSGGPGVRRWTGDSKQDVSSSDFSHGADGVGPGSGLVDVVESLDPDEAGEGAPLLGNAGDIALEVEGDDPRRPTGDPRNAVAAAALEIAQDRLRVAADDAARAARSAQRARQCGAIISALQDALTPPWGAERQVREEWASGWAMATNLAGAATFGAAYAGGVRLAYSVAGGFLALPAPAGLTMAAHRLARCAQDALAARAVALAGRALHGIGEAEAQLDVAEEFIGAGGLPPGRGHEAALMRQSVDQVRGDVHRALGMPEPPPDDAV